MIWKPGRSRGYWRSKSRGVFGIGAKCALCQGHRRERGIVGRPSYAGATTPRIDARLEKLETQAHSDSEVVVFAMPDETVADCVRRHGRDPDDGSVRYTVVRWACESDARL
jgi:hypothetical protein